MIISSTIIPHYPVLGLSIFPHIQYFHLFLHYHFSPFLLPSLHLYHIHTSLITHFPEFRYHHNSPFLTPPFPDFLRRVGIHLFFSSFHASLGIFHHSISSSTSRFLCVVTFTLPSPQPSEIFFTMYTFLSHYSQFFYNHTIIHTFPIPTLPRFLSLCHSSPLPFPGLSSFIFTLTLPVTNLPF